MVYALVVDFVYLLDFDGKFSNFGMVQIVAVFVCNILVYMVRLVFNNHHHQMTSNLCNKAFVVFSYFVEKMGNYHCDLVEGVNYFENLLNWLMCLGDSNSENIRGCYFFVEGDLFLMNVRNYSYVLQNCFL